MISRVGQAVPRFLAGTSVAGDGMRERLQAATFAMFGMVTAIGLVLVGVAYNQSWPDFADSPIPGIPTERVGKATIAAGAVHGQARSGNGAASHRSPPEARAGVVPDRSSALHGSPQQQLPTPAPGGPGPAPSGQGGVDVPVSHAPAPAGQPPATFPAPVAAQPAPAPAPSPPAAEPADTASVPPNGKAKGHEKADKPAKPEKTHGKPAPVTPVVPPPPSVPAPGAATPDTPAPAAGSGNGNGKGNPKGHEK